MTKTVPITRRALMQRVNRALGKGNKMLKPSRGARAQAELGAYFIIDLQRNSVLRKNVDPEDLARELDVLKEFERVSD